MNKLIAIICALGSWGALSACTNKTSLDTESQTVVEMVATHAIDTNDQITSLTFIPNNVAPWLGRIILRTESGKLHATDIEGRTPLKIGTHSYLDTFGIFRKNAAGVFLAINESNHLEAFIQSDDAGNFKSMTYSGTGLNVIKFCHSPLPQSNTVKLLTSDGKITTIEIVIQDTVIEHIEISTNKAPQDTIACAYDDAKIYALSKSASTSTSIHIANLLAMKNWTLRQSIPNILTLHLLGYSQNQHLGVISDIMHLLSVQTERTDNFEVSIKDGLSIRGLARVDYVQATTANYGGGAFKGGVIAMIDTQSPRIVFVSLEYAQSRLTVRTANSQ